MLSNHLWREKSRQPLKRRTSVHISYRLHPADESKGQRKPGAEFIVGTEEFRRSFFLEAEGGSGEDAVQVGVFAAHALARAVETLRDEGVDTIVDAARVGA